MENIAIRITYKAYKNNLFQNECIKFLKIYTVVARFAYMLRYERPQDYFSLFLTSLLSEYCVDIDANKPNDFEGKYLKGVSTEFKSYLIRT